MKKLSESIWSDIHGRSIGDGVRKEDDINLLDFDDFYHYILDHYEKTNYMDSTPLKNKDYIGLPLFVEGQRKLNRIFISLDLETQKIQKVFIDCSVKHCGEFIDKLKEKFTIDENSGFTPVEIYPKEGEYTNTICLDIFDTIIENVSKPSYRKKGKISESVWSDIHSRSVGDTVRKEDDIDKFNRDEMLEYIYSIYTNNPSVRVSVIKSENSNSKYFDIPLFLYGNALYRLTVQYRYDEIYRIILKASKRECETFYDEMAKKFSLTLLENGTIQIDKKNIAKISDNYHSYNVSNKLVMEFIEFVTDIVSTKKPENGYKLLPMLIKKEN